MRALPRLQLCSDYFSIFWGIFLGPLIVWLVKRGDSPEVDAHGKESLNFQISMLIYDAIAGVLCLVLIGFILLAILHLLNTVLVIIASIKASEKTLSVSDDDPID